MALNKIEYDSFAGFNPARNYANFAEWFVNFLETSKLPTSSLSKDFLTSPAMVYAFNNFITNGTPLTFEEIKQRLDKTNPADFPTGDHLWKTFNNAINIYKVIKFNKQNKLIKNVDHIWFQNQIFQNLGKKVDKTTLASLSKIYQKELNSYINEYLTSKEVKNGSAFDSIFWGVVNNREKNDLEKLFWCWQHYKKGGDSFSVLYNKAKPEQNNPDEFAEWSHVIQSLGLCATFGKVAKNTKLFTDKLKYVKPLPGQKEGHYEIIPPEPPKKFPFTEQEVDNYLVKLKDYKLKSHGIQKEKTKPTALYKITNDKRLDGVNFATFAEYLVALKVAYKLKLTPAQLFQANIVDYGRKGSNGSQWVDVPNFGRIRINTKLDTSLSPMYTATGGHGDIEVFVTRKDHKGVFVDFEPTVYENFRAVVGGEQYGVYHVLDNLKDSGLTIGVFKLASFFGDKDIVNEFTSLNTMRKFESHQENVDLFTHCDTFESIPKKFETLMIDLKNPTSTIYQHEYIPEQEKMYQENAKLKAEIDKLKKSKKIK